MWLLFHQQCEAAWRTTRDVFIFSVMWWSGRIGRSTSFLLHCFSNRRVVLCLPWSHAGQTRCKSSGKKTMESLVKWTVNRIFGCFMGGSTSTWISIWCECCGCWGENEREKKGARAVGGRECVDQRQDCPVRRNIEWNLWAYEQV